MPFFETNRLISLGIFVIVRLQHLYFTITAFKENHDSKWEKFLNGTYYHKHK